MRAALLIFVFAGVSSGLGRPILAEFAPVPNAIPVEAPHDPAAVNQGPAVATHVHPAGTIAARPMEVGGPEGPEPTRFGDWEKNGRCVDF